MARRLFTPAQANRTLPLVRKIVQDILETGGRMRGLANMIHNKGGRLCEEERAQFDEIKDEVSTLVRELEAVGCQYKDWGFELGLVDFPARIDGQPVLLCWRSDEAVVSWYHSYRTGFEGRKAIPSELLEEVAES